MPWEGRGIGRTKKNPRTMGKDVPSPSTSRKSDAFPGKSVWEIKEKKNAESPKADITTPRTIARWTGFEHTRVG